MAEKIVKKMRTGPSAPSAKYLKVFEWKTVPVIVSVSRQGEKVKIKGFVREVDVEVLPGVMARLAGTVHGLGWEEVEGEWTKVSEVVLHKEYGALSEYECPEGTCGFWFLSGVRSLRRECEEELEWAGMFVFVEQKVVSEAKRCGKCLVEVPSPLGACAI